jgi:23S rRNA (cytidine2498-2'-O)-methyltransferase
MSHPPAGKEGKPQKRKKGKPQGGKESDMSKNVLIYCRPGFEREAAAEIQEAAGARGVAGFIKARPDSGFVVFQGYGELPSGDPEALHWRELVFARQLVFLSGELLTLAAADRITPLLEAIRASGGPYRELRMETADTNEAKSLAGFLKKFGAPLQSVMTKQGLLQRRAEKTLHLFFLDSTAAYLGWSLPDNASHWENGIPRLKFPAEAPSRSTLKLEEAILHFLGKTEQEEWLRDGKTAVDLGASPGGWTWQLVKRGMMVTAIDNGAMDSKLMGTGAVEHLRVDGFRYLPERPVNWLVCDMIEKPARIAELMARWLAGGHAERAIFNLKLPMKKRYEEVQHCLDIIHDVMRNTPYYVEVKQLYHDREEVTAYLARD